MSEINPSDKNEILKAIQKVSEQIKRLEVCVEHLESLGEYGRNFDQLCPQSSHFFIVDDDDD